MKMRKGISIEDFLKEIKEIKMQLVVVGETVQIMFNALPRHYESFIQSITLLDTFPPFDKLVEEMLYKHIVEPYLRVILEMRRQSRKNESDKTFCKKSYCIVCGKEGHWAKECHHHKLDLRIIHTNLVSGMLLQQKTTLKQH